MYNVRLVREQEVSPTSRGAGAVVVTAQKLSFEHKQVVVASGGLWALATADEAALRLHSMRKVRRRGTQLMAASDSISTCLHDEWPLHQGPWCLLQAGGGGSDAAAGFKGSGSAAAGAQASSCSGGSRRSNMAETLVLYAMGKLAAKLDRWS